MSNMSKKAQIIIREFNFNNHKTYELRIRLPECRIVMEYDEIFLSKSSLVETLKTIAEEFNLEILNRETVEEVQSA